MRRKANGKQKEWEERYNARRKAKMDAAKAAIRAEDMEKGIFTTVSQLPRQEPRKATVSASAAINHHSAKGMNMSELTYTRCGDYYIPDLKLSEQPEAPIGKYGRMRQRYPEGTPAQPLQQLDFERKAVPAPVRGWTGQRVERMDAMLPRMMEAAGRDRGTESP